MTHTKHADWTCSCGFRSLSPSLTRCPLCARPRRPRDARGRFTKRTDERKFPVMYSSGETRLLPRPIELAPLAPLNSYFTDICGKRYYYTERQLDALIKNGERTLFNAAGDRTPAGDTAEQKARQAELKLYSDITGRAVGSYFGLEDWQNEYAITGQSIAWERMLAAVTEHTPSYLLDGSVVQPAASRTLPELTRYPLAVRLIPPLVIIIIALICIII